MTEIILIAVVGSVLAWAMLPLEIHPNVQARLDRLPRRTCPTCFGGGKALGADGSWKTCPRCKGSGNV